MLVCIACLKRWTHYHINGMSHRLLKSRVKFLDDMMIISPDEKIFFFFKEDLKSVCSSICKKYPETKNHVDLLGRE